MIIRRRFESADIRHDRTDIKLRSVNSWLILSQCEPVHKNSSLSVNNILNNQADKKYTPEKNISSMAKLIKRILFWIFWWGRKSLNFNLIQIKRTLALVVFSLCYIIRYTGFWPSKWGDNYWRVVKSRAPRYKAITRSLWERHLTKYDVTTP